jgi:hypothetical protein
VAQKPTGTFRGVQRSFGEEYRRRAEAARQRGTTYAIERREREAARQRELHPAFRFEGNRIDPGFAAEDQESVGERPTGMQAPFSPVSVDEWQYLAPTPSMAPTAKEKRRRSIMARYSPDQLRLEIQWRDANWTHWTGVPGVVWNRLQRAQSTGVFVDQVLMREFPMGRGGGGSIVGQ